MKILGIGVDIIENNRIKNSIKNHKFRDRIYSKNELELSSSSKNKIGYFSKRFAAKEAFAKALGTGFRNNLNFKDIKLSKELNADCVEIHTGRISNLVKSKKRYNEELNRIKKCSILANKLNIEVHAGHGLDYKTTKILNKINEIQEFNIGHFIIGEAIFRGLHPAIAEMRRLMDAARADT